MKSYIEFLKSKEFSAKTCGIKMPIETIKKKFPSLFDYQVDIVRWAVAKGRSAIFAGTGLGKTRMQLAWASVVGGDVLIFAPLAVDHQTVKEGEKMGLAVHIATSNEDIKSGINITNYEKMDKFDFSRFHGLVLDESSILKSQTGKIRTELINKSKDVPFRLACTATPAPNDYMELGNHSEFLGIMTELEMLAMFFIHDGSNTSKWRLKGHAVSDFWEWVSSWAVMMTNPTDLGYDGEKFELPPLTIRQITVQTETMDGFLFPVEASTLQERQQTRRESIMQRVAAAAELVNQSQDTWLIWCNLNAEGEALKAAIPGAVEVKGSDKAEYKTQMMEDFSDGKIRVLISKPSICGFGMNWQHCHNMIFVGLSDSFEQYYQAVRRCWRFGQTHEVNVYFVVADTEGAVVANIRRKEQDFECMLKGMIQATQHITENNIRSTKRQQSRYEPHTAMRLPEWLKGETA